MRELSQIQYVRLWGLDIPREKNGLTIVNSGDPDQTVLDLGLHCLLITLLWTQTKMG